MHCLSRPAHLVSLLCCSFVASGTLRSLHWCVKHTQVFCSTYGMVLVQVHALEGELFGGAEDVLSSMQQPADASESHSNKEAELSILSYVRDLSTVEGLQDQLAVDVGTAQQQVTVHQKRLAAQKRCPAWIDDENGNMEVDISAVPKLRKLRKVDGEAAIDGAHNLDSLPGDFSTLIIQQGSAHATHV
jgi:hypothetical protein